MTAFVIFIQQFLYEKPKVISYSDIYWLSVLKIEIETKIRNFYL